MKSILILLAVLGAPVFAGETVAVAPSRTVELIADRTFERGFRLNETDASKQIVKWGDTRAPVWEINHHFSKSSFTNLNSFCYRQDGLTFQDDYSSLIVHPEDKSADFILGLNACKEYGGVYRQKGDPWPHIYLTQRISKPNGHLRPDGPAISELEKIDFSISVRLLRDNKNFGPGYKRSTHAAQFLIFFTIQNLNRQSKGYGDYYWFGVALYDDRELVTMLHAMQDKGSPKKKGTDKLIYNVGVKPFTSEVVADGKWVAVRGDILPHIVAGLREAWKRGFLLDSQNLADYRIGGLVMGWEIPGLNDVAIAVKDLRATATTVSPVGK